MIKQGKESIKVPKIKIIAIAVFIVMIFNLIVPTAFAVAENISNTEITSDSAEDWATDETEMPTIVGEDANKREENIKTFWLDNGAEVAAIYPEAVHYMQDGKFVDIDNNLTDALDEMSDQILKNKANNFSIELVKQTNSNKLFTIKSKDYKINMSLNNANKVRATQNFASSTLSEGNKKYKGSEKLNLKNLQSSVTYEGILNNIDIEYDVQSTKVKENIILKNSEAINQSIIFTLDVGNKLKVEMTKDNQILIYETDINKPVYIMDRLFMYDSMLENSGDIEVKLEATKKKGEYTLTILPNKEWLEDETRVYPVTIDPTVKASVTTGIQDTYIYNGDGSDATRHLLYAIRVGSNNLLSGPTRGLIKFILPQLNSGDQVIDATLYISNYMASPNWTPPSSAFNIDVHKVTSFWNEDSVFWSGINTSYDSKVEDYFTYSYDSANPKKQNSVNITSLAKDWYTNGNNYGVMLMDNTEATGLNRTDAYLFSTNTSSLYVDSFPSVLITYRNQTGLEDYLSYHTQNIGRAGTVYTNDYNGNLTLVHNDATTPGDRMPASIYHVYNSNDKDINSKYGNGFRLNMSTTITLETIGGVSYAKYIDEDGTAHYFTQTGTYTYADEDNIGLTLTLNGTTFTMQDLAGNKQNFEKRTVGGIATWGLKEVLDTDNNKIVIGFDSGSPNDFVIRTITDGAGAIITLDYTSGKLSSITDTVFRVTQYKYDTSGNLTQIIYPDTKTATYTYSNKLLTSVKNMMLCM
ncbi:MAG: DUF6531 domain-containing protein [Oscillospiraceae bacterium]|nr:DUF6531 domain-containing protein [Oscillospiraceae bacterium]